MGDLIERIKQATFDGETELVDEFSDPLPPPVTLEQLEDAEKQLGFRLPKLLRQLYLNVSNGGFYPGVLGLANGWIDPTEPSEENALQMYLEMREYEPSRNDWEVEPEERWREGLFPLTYNGCTVYTMVDCLTESYPMVIWDAGHVNYESNTNFDDWIQNAVEGYEQFY